RPAHDHEGAGALPDERAPRALPRVSPAGAGRDSTGRHGVVMPRRVRALRPILLLLATVGVLVVESPRVMAQVLILPPELMEKLVPANERPLNLGPDGEALRFKTGTERWEEAMPPGMIDVDRNGTKDYIVFILVDEDSGRRALVARVWGDAADAFGPTVFYVI